MIQAEVFVITQGDPLEFKSCGTFTLQGGKIVSKPSADDGSKRVMQYFYDEMPLGHNESVTPENSPEQWLRMLPDQFARSSTTAVKLTGAEPILWKFGG